ncbi:MAG: hypothetical protein HN909_05315 [Phycisphaerales bacterium]|jgi:UDP-N-acetylglucosamine acyltransferase|nr:hypothetical protein [Phycisphaerales bacterium]MBT7171172.1 hypothetical protein [Phycisphaerales bacterium]
MDEFSTTIIEPGAKIGENVDIGPFTYIGPKVRIGDDCVIDSNVTITGNTTIGAGCHIFPNSVIGVADPEGSSAAPKCIIGERNLIREHVTIYGGTGRKPTRIGTNNLIMVASQIGGGANLADHILLANSSFVAGGAIVEDYVRASAFCHFEKGVRVGNYSFVAGYVHADRDVPPYAIVQGTPLRVRGVNSHNLKACGFGESDIRTLKRVFRDIYNGTGELNLDVVNDLARDKTLPAIVTDLLKLLKKSARRK